MTYPQPLPPGLAVETPELAQAYQHIERVEGELKNLTYLVAALIYKVGPQVLSRENLQNAPQGMSLRVHSDPSTMTVIIELADIPTEGDKDA